MANRRSLPFEHPDYRSPDQFMAQFRPYSGRPYKTFTREQRGAQNVRDAVAKAKSMHRIAESHGRVQAHDPYPVGGSRERRSFYNEAAQATRAYPGLSEVFQREADREVSDGDFESKHPRHPKGEPDGGKFRDKD